MAFGLRSRGVARGPAQQRAEEWLDRLIEWPRSTAWMERLAAQLDATMQSGIATRPIRLPVYGVIPRNLFFLVVVLLHGARRALPPYG